MKRTGKCPKCGSVDVYGDAVAIDRGPGGPDDLYLVSFLRWRFLSYKSGGGTPLSAWVCRDCGYVEFYADSPKQLTRDEKPAD